MTNRGGKTKGKINTIDMNRRKRSNLWNVVYEENREKINRKQNTLMDGMTLF